MSFQRRRLFKPGGVGPILNYNFAVRGYSTFEDARAKGPIPSIVRASVDSRFDENGLMTFPGNNIEALTHDPVTGQSHGLQVPAAAARLDTAPEDLGDAAWVNTNSATLTVNDLDAPDGNTTADKADDQNAGGNAHFAQTLSVADDTVIRCYSHHVAKTTSESHFACFSVSYSGGTGKTDYIVINTNTGAISATNGSPNNTGIFDAGDYWRFFIASANNGLGNTSFTFRPYPAVNTDGTTAFVAATTGAKHFWGSQVEVGTFPTPYIPGSSRAATSATIALASVSVDLTDFTWLFKGRTAAGISINQYLGQIDDGTNNNRVAMFREPTLKKITFFVADGGATQADGAINATVPDDTDFAVALWSKANSFYAALNVGGTITTRSDLAGTMPAGMTTKRFGTDLANSQPLDSSIAHDVMFNGGSEQFVRQLVQAA